MSIGFPDGQRITQWLGAPLVQAAGAAIGNVLHTDGPFNLASWASVVIAIKPTGGNVTVTLRQRISGGPVSLEEQGSFVVPDGQVFFESVVLFGDAVYLDLTGSAVGVTVDYALYPSNTTTNAQVLAAATINGQHNEVLVAAEPTLDFVDGGGFAFTLTDDPTNTRLKVALLQAPIASTRLLAAAASIDIQNIAQTFLNLHGIAIARATAAFAASTLGLRFNNDATGSYDVQRINASAAAVSADETFAQTFLEAGRIVGTSAASVIYFGRGEFTIPSYTDTVAEKGVLERGSAKTNTTAGTMNSSADTGWWRGGAVAVNRLTLFSPSGGNLDIGSYFGLYGEG